MAKVTIQSTMKDGDRIIVSAQVEFDAKEFTADEAARFVESAISAAQNKAAALAAVHIDGVQAEINRQLGLSPLVFARYNTA